MIEYLREFALKGSNSKVLVTGLVMVFKEISCPLSQNTNRLLQKLILN
jgi:hypothetical protein